MNKKMKNAKNLMFGFLLFMSLDAIAATYKCTGTYISRSSNTDASNQEEIVGFWANELGNNELLNLEFKTAPMRRQIMISHEPDRNNNRLFMGDFCGDQWLEVNIGKDPGEIISGEMSFGPEPDHDARWSAIWLRCEKI